MSPQQFDDWLASTRRPTLVMGILNVTPDSFSDGGRFDAVDRALAHADEMIAAGVDLIDVGGESTRPGSARVDSGDQIARVLPVIESLAKRPITVSIDTTRAPVARAAIDAGAALVNDVSAGLDDADMPAVVAEVGRPVCLMHMRGQPGTMQSMTDYDDVVEEVRAHLLARAADFETAGVPRRNILIDPGIGFAKTAEQNWSLLKKLDRYVDSPYPVLVGASRKGFIGKLLDLPAAADRDTGTMATVAWCVAQRVAVVRVHDVKAARQTVDVMRAIIDAAI